jgi:hypothetical protein
VFAIDVSGPAVASGATAATCQCIEQVLDSLQGAGGGGGGTRAACRRPRAAHPALSIAASDTARPSRAPRCACRRRRDAGGRGHV